MGKLLSNIHWFIILFAAYNVYTYFEGYQERLDQTEARIPALQRKIRNYKKDLQVLEKQFQNIEDAKKRIAQVTEVIKELQKKLPSEISDPENLSLIRGIAESLKLKEIGMSPTDEVNKGFYIVKKYEFTAKGTYLQFLLFFERIAENEQLLNIKEIKLETKDKGQRGRFQVIHGKAIIEAYRYNPSHREESVVETLKNKG